jgi:hypothetical protein
VAWFVASASGLECALVKGQSHLSHFRRDNSPNSAAAPPGPMARKRNDAEFFAKDGQRRRKGQPTAATNPRGPSDQGGYVPQPTFVLPST